jgi:hypothetical protein
MKNTNQRATPIAWMPGRFVASDVPLGNPAAYYAAVNGTDRLFERLGVKR